MTGAAARADRPREVPKEAPKVVVVVLNWCGEADTRACLESLLCSAGHPFEILLVDNGSPDGSGERLRAAFPQVAYLQTGRNHGFTGGNNRGIEGARAAGAEYVVVLNNDTVVASDCVSRLVETARAHPRAGAVAPTMLVHDAPDVVWYAGGTLSLGRGAGLHAGAGRPAPRVDERMRPVETTFVTGCCVLLTRDAIDVVGGFEDSFFAYCEDVDLSYRLARAGFALLHEPRARLTPKVPVGDAEPSPFQIVQRDRNRRRFVAMRLGAARRARFAMWFYATRLALLARYALRRDWARARAIWQGAWS